MFFSMYKSFKMLIFFLKFPKSNFKERNFRPNRNHQAGFHSTYALKSSMTQKSLPGHYIVCSSVSTLCLSDGKFSSQGEFPASKITGGLFCRFPDKGRKLLRFLRYFKDLSPFIQRFFETFRDINCRKKLGNLEQKFRIYNL